MYTCILRVRHISAHGDPYTRMHVVPVHTTLQEAVLACGAQPPRGATASLLCAGASMPEIVYTDGVHPISIDPAAVVVHLDGLQGGVWVHVPYQCTFEHLMRQLIPSKLRSIGVHPHDVQGAPARESGEPVFARHLWCDRPRVQVWWTKLGHRVSYAWPERVLRGVRALQQIQKKNDAATESDVWAVL